MRAPRRAAAAALLPLLAAAPAGGESSVAVWANYYKERSTRVIEPIIRVGHDLPRDAHVEVTYAVDQITSASGAFTPSDEPFTEHRHELRVAGRRRWRLAGGRALTPGASLRFSHEPDYASLGYGGELAWSLDRDATVLRVYGQRLEDWVGQRTNAEFAERLGTTLVGASFTQVLRRDLLGTVALEHQRLRGYQENPYRVENHPRARDRWAASAQLAYHLARARTTARLGYRFYADDWDLTAHTVDLELTRRLSADLDVSPRVRLHTQDGVFFARLGEGGYLTADPKLRGFDSQLYGITLRWTLSALRGTAAAPFARSRLEPSYAYLDQHNFYGAAHVIQLGWWWPF